MTSRIPPLLEPYLSLPPEASLILLTSVLGASSNWLVLRFLHSVLLKQDANLELSSEYDTKVLLVSFTRDFAFWKELGRRSGIDFDKSVAKKRFAFVDGLSGLFLPRKVVERDGESILTKSDLTSVAEEILKVVGTLKGGDDGRGKTILVIDQIDLLLAAGGNQVTAIGMEAMLMVLREQVHATVVTLDADYPLVSSLHTPLEREHASLLVSLAHQADFIMNLRLLDSGTARDVSGVIRITVGDEASDVDRDVQKRIEEKELLFFVGGDGGVRVFERGQ